MEEVEIGTGAFDTKEASILSLLSSTRKSDEVTSSARTVEGAGNASADPDINVSEGSTSTVEVKAVNVVAETMEAMGVSLRDDSDTVFTGRVELGNGRSVTT